LPVSVCGAVEARAFGLARIGLGVAALLMGVELWGELPTLLSPGLLRLPYPLPLPAPPPRWLPLLMTVWGAAAVAFLVGWRSRAAGAILCLLAGWLLFLDQQLYSNHFYLLWLLLILFTAGNAGARVSLDARRHGDGPVPRWPVTLSRVQLSAVYGFGGLAKINASYLAGGIIARPLAHLAGWLGVVPGPGLVGAAAMLTIACELLLAVGLWLPRLWWLCAGVGLAFHLAILFLLGPDLGLTVFAIETLSLYLLFAPAVRRS
jgi:hypothetical protein